MKSKFSSRKFLAALIAESAGIITTVTGLISSLLRSGHPAVVVTGAILTVLSGVAYCIVEGRLDEQSIRASGNALANAADALGANKVGDLIGGVADAAADVVGDCAVGDCAEKTVPEDGKAEDDEPADIEGRRIGF